MPNHDDEVEEKAAELEAPCKIFISHKSDEKETAELFKAKLETYAAGKFECFISEQIPHGKDWLEEIRRSLLEARVLLLLLTRPEIPLDWQLYEAGLATSLREPGRCRTVCFHPEGVSPPDPVKHYQAVEATKEGIMQFLQQLFGGQEIVEADPPINQAFANSSNEISAVAKELSKRFRVAKTWEQRFTNYLVLRHDGTPIEEPRIPPTMMVDDNSKALEMFNMAQAPPDRPHWTWQDIEDRMGSEGNGEWINELGERIYWASRGDILHSTAATFVCRKTKVPHRPILHRCEQKPDGTMQFEVLFVECSPPNVNEDE